MVIMMIAHPAAIAKRNADYLDPVDEEEDLPDLEGDDP